MILFITNSYTATIDALCKICEKSNLTFFRFNIDFWDKYQFHFEDNFFYIRDPLGRECKSPDIDYYVFYKWNLRIGEYTDNNGNDANWIASTINNIMLNIAYFSKGQQSIRLFTVSESSFPKSLQMRVAKKYWNVPEWSIDFGHELPNMEIMVKQLSSRGYNGKALDVKKANAHNLSPAFPWFIQKPARGNRDATVLYINGRVHPFQFMTERKDLTDWRVTQGTPLNKWTHWNANKEFENQICRYMNDMKLKFGRLDFIIGDTEPEFLEVNPCGQFGWLDDKNFSLHKEVLNAILDPSSAIEI